MKTKMAFGWLVQVSNRPGGKGDETIQRFNVAEPNKDEAVKSVRRRVPGGEGATVVALEGLSRHTVYNLLRLRRGDMTAAL
jgi:hypothetical protein